MSPVVPMTAIIVIPLARPVAIRSVASLRRGRKAALYNLVKFAAVEPNASTLGAVVDLHTLPVTHHQGNPARGT